MNHSTSRLRCIAAGAVLALTSLTATAVTGVAPALAASTAITTQPLDPPADLVASIPTPFTLKATQAPNTYVGKLASNPSGLAAIVNGSNVLFYWCDGKAPGDWFGGTNANGTVAGESAKGITVKGKLVRGKLTGTLSRGGKTFTFSLAKAANGTGVFRTTSTPGAKPGAVLGWIALDNALVGATNEADGTVTDAVPFSLGGKFGGGCFRIRRAITVMANHGADPSTVFGMKVDGMIAGCKTSDLGISPT